MKHYIIIAFVSLLLSLNVRAQLAVNADWKVGIGTETEFFTPIMMAGDHTHFRESNNISIGMAGSPEVKNTRNIGVFGVLPSNSNNSSNTNFGILGIVESTSSNSGRNYGLCGMVGNLGAGEYHGGAGIYATCYDYFFSHPTNLSGLYSAYFAGNTHVSNNLTALGMFTPCDSRLTENVESLGDRNGNTTLQNLLNMNVVEYNMKSTLGEYSPADATPEMEEKMRAEYERLKQEDRKMISRRHYGVDARELQKVYPDLVLEGQDGHLYVNYIEMVPLIIRSVQELKQEIDEVKDDSY